MAILSYLFEKPKGQRLPIQSGRSLQVPVRLRREAKGQDNGRKVWTLMSFGRVGFLLE